MMLIARALPALGSELRSAGGGGGGGGGGGSARHAVTSGFGGIGVGTILVNTTSGKQAVTPAGANNG